MNINDLIVNGINEITVNDSLNAPLIKISIKNTSETVIPTDNKYY